ncbi:MAG: hypothetical protein MUP33_07895, partial [Polaromonas sp.]|nr:hypothetical protein [Polaromonas sp.]
MHLLGAVQTIASVTARPLRREVLREQVAWIAELAGRTIEAPHDSERFANRLNQVMKGFETGPAKPAAQR